MQEIFPGFKQDAIQPTYQKQWELRSIINSKAESVNADKLSGRR